MADGFSLDQIGPAQTSQPDLPVRSDAPPPPAGGGGQQGPTSFSLHEVGAPQAEGSQGGSQGAPQTEPPSGSIVVPEGQGAGLRVNFFNALNDGVARLLGVPADVAASFLAPTYWKSLPTEEKDKLRQESPRQAAVMDFLEKTTDDPSLGYKWWRGVMGEAGSIREGVEPQNTGERMAAAAGSTTSALVVPGLSAEAILAKEWNAGTELLSGVLKSAEIDAGTIAHLLKGGGFFSNLMMGTTSGAAGEYAKEKAPEPLKPTAEVLGQLAGGLPAAAVDSFLTKMYRGVVDSMHRLFNPTETTNFKAAREIADAAARSPEGRQDFETKLRNSEDNIQGSDLTSFQATGNKEVGQLEKEVAGTSYGAPKFQQRREDQQIAQLGQIESIADPQARSEAVRDWIKTTLRDIENEHAENVKQAAYGVADRMAEAGGTRHTTEADYGEAMRDPMAEAARRSAKRVRALENAIDPTGQVPVDTSGIKQAFEQIEASVPKAAKGPAGDERQILKVVSDGFEDQEPFGEIITLRQRIEEEMRKVRNSNPDSYERLDKMLAAVDDTMAERAGAAAAEDPSVVARLRGTSPEEPVSGPERAQVQVGDRSVEALRDPATSDVEALVKEDPNSMVVMARDPTSGRTFAWISEPGQNRAVADGLGLGQDAQFNTVRTKDGRMFRASEGESEGDVRSNLDQFLGRPSVTLTEEQAAAAPTVYGVVGDDLTGGIFVTSNRAAAARMAARQDADVIPFKLKPGAAIGPGQIAPGKVVQTTDLESQTAAAQRGRAARRARAVDEFNATAARQQEATAAREIHEETYERGPVGQVLATTGTGDYKTVARNVANRIFDDPEKFDAFLRAAPHLEQEIADYAAFSMRRAAAKDGVISPTKLNQWIDDHAHVFRRFPELMTKFRNVEGAQAVLDQALANQRAALEQFQDSALGRVLGSGKVSDIVGGALRDPEEFGRLVDQVRRSPEALSGLKRAVIEHMLSVGRGLSTKEAGTSGLGRINGDSIIKFLANNAESLARLYSPAEMDNMRSVARDIVMTNRSVEAARGGNKAERTATGLAFYIIRHAFAAAGAVAGHAMGIGGVVGGHHIGLMTGAGADIYIARRLARVDAAIVDMMLNRSLASAWLAKLSVREASNPRFADMMARRIRTATWASTVRAMEEHGE